MLLNHFRKKLNTIFMKNLKSCHKNQLLFFLSYKKCLKLFSKRMPIRHPHINKIQLRIL